MHLLNNSSTLWFWSKLANLIMLILAVLTIHKIETHQYHETQLPRGYGNVQQLQLTPPQLNFSYLSNIDTPATELFIGTTMSSTFIDHDNDNKISGNNDSDLFLPEDGFVEQTRKRPASSTKPNVIQYLWSVYNFSVLLNESQELIFSPRFYLNEPGFRLQLLLITNTTYSDMVSYLGVFFRIVAGDYDSEIEWPYKHRTILSVLKHEELDNWTQKELAGKNEPLCTKYNYTVIPNIDECRLRSSFLRPNSDVEMSLNADGCGSRRHIPLSVLESDRYLQDDTLIILVTVQMNSDYEEKIFRDASMSMRYNELVSNYYWTIEQFSHKKNESLFEEKIVILNSEPFYTHSNGYLIQLFLTILPKRSAFAVSMAFLQGDHDRYLQWPFPYGFEMAIVDQSPDYWKRDLSVKMKPSKSDCGTEPFGLPGQQPEFCFLTIQSLQVLSLTHYNFLLNDTLKIRFTTKFERYSARQRSSILLRNNRLVSEFNWLIPGLISRFERYLNDPGPSSHLFGSNMLRKTHRFVSDEFYTNGQGYLCQLVLTVSVENFADQQFKPIQTQSEKLNNSSNINETMSGLPLNQSQNILVFSLELVIIEGEYDRFLDWPFNNAFELAIVGYKSQTELNENNPAGGHFYFVDNQSTENNRLLKMNTKLVVPLSKVENGQCLKESFQKPIKQNPPCGIKEFFRMDIGNEHHHNHNEQIHSSPPPKQHLKLSKDITLSGSGKASSYELGSLAKTDEDLHLRIRIYL